MTVQFALFTILWLWADPVYGFPKWSPYSGNSLSLGVP